MFWSKNAIYLSLGLHKVRPSYRRSLQLSKEAIQHFKHELLKFFYFCGSFLPSWIRIRIPNPDPLTRLNPDPIRIRISNSDLNKQFFRQLGDLKWIWQDLSSSESPPGEQLRAAGPSSPGAEPPPCTVHNHIQRFCGSRHSISFNK